MTSPVINPAASDARKSAAAATSSGSPILPSGVSSADSDKQLVYTFDAESVDCRRWMPNETVCEQIRLDLRNTKPGTYLLELGLFENDTPILLGMQPEYYDNGWYQLTQIEVL